MEGKAFQSFDSSSKETISCSACQPVGSSSNRANPGTTYEKFPVGHRPTCINRHALPPGRSGQKGPDSCARPEQNRPIGLTNPGQEGRNRIGPQDRTSPDQKLNRTRPRWGVRSAFPLQHIRGTESFPHTGTKTRTRLLRKVAVREIGQWTQEGSIGHDQRFHVSKQRLCRICPQTEQDPTQSCTSRPKSTTPNGMESTEQSL